MWAKGSGVEAVAQSAGTSKSLEFTSPNIKKALQGSSQKLEQLYSFVITLLPYIDAAILPNSSPTTAAQDDYLQKIRGLAPMTAIVWFCAQLKMEFKPDLKVPFLDIARQFQNNSDYIDYVPDVTLRKVEDEVLKSLDFARMGITRKQLESVATGVGNYLAGKIAHLTNPNLKVNPHM